MTSAASSLRGSVPATLPHHLRFHCLHAPPPLGPPLARTPTTPATAPRAHAPARNTQHHPRTAGVRKHPLTAQAAADACSIPLSPSDVSCVIPPRLGASDAAPSARISLSARTAAPRPAPCQNPTTPATAPCTSATARNTQHHQRIAGVRKHPLTAQLAADSCSIPLSPSDVSCVIPPRLGASDAAPSSPM